MDADSEDILEGKFTDGKSGTLAAESINGTLAKGHAAPAAEPKKEENAETKVEEVAPSPREPAPEPPAETPAAVTPKGKGKGAAAPPAATKGKGKGKGTGKDKGSAAAAPAKQVEPRKPDVKPKAPMKRLFWNSFRLADPSSDTIWAEIERDGAILDTEELETLFSDAARSASKTQSLDTPRAERPKVRKIQVLSTERRKQVLIMVAKLPKGGDTMEALESMDFSKLDTNQVELLVLNMPQADEIKALTNAENALRDARAAISSTDEEAWAEIGVLDTAEEFMVLLMKVPCWDLRLRAWHFECSFREKIEPIATTQGNIARGCEAMLASKGIKQLLAYLLYLGNYLNGGTTRGRADGFAIDTLSQVRSVKMAPQEGRAAGTLVDYLVEQMDRNHREDLDGIFQAGGAMESVLCAAKKPKEEDEQELKDATYAALRLRDALRQAADESNDLVLAQHAEVISMCCADLENVASRFGLLSSRYEKLCAWFCVGDTGSAKKTTVEFFGLFASFLGDVRKVWTASREQEAAALRRLQRSQSRGRAATWSQRCDRSRSDSRSTAGGDSERRSRTHSHSIPRRRGCSAFSGDADEQSDADTVASEVQSKPSSDVGEEWALTRSMGAGEEVQS